MMMIYLQRAVVMPRTFLVERTVSMSSSVKDTQTKTTNDFMMDDRSHKLTDEVRCENIQRTDEQHAETEMNPPRSTVDNKLG